MKVYFVRLKPALGAPVFVMIRDLGGFNLDDDVLQDIAALNCEHGFSVVHTKVVKRKSFVGEPDFVINIT